ncbi:hypothetical protein KEJ39_02590 [Candidatus Bathyarchaeota archaeon]|nr:hypothetical protein [Candidatus Bathyarchaeota archaeon]
MEDLAVTALFAATIVTSGSFLYLERQQAAPSMGGYANPQLLVDGEWTLTHLSESNVRIIDVRRQAEYDRGHIQNAVRLEIKRLTMDINGVKK